MVIVAHAYPPLSGHKVAWEKKGVLHRDISDTNVVMVGDDGIILDWDLCKKLRAMDKGPTSRQRSVRNIPSPMLRPVPCLTLVPIIGHLDLSFRIGPQLPPEAVRSYRRSGIYLSCPCHHVLALSQA